MTYFRFGLDSGLEESRARKFFVPPGHDVLVDWFSRAGSGDKNAASWICNGRWRVSFPPSFQVFRQAMRNLGYVDGKNFVIDYRHAERKDGNIPSLVAEVVRDNIDVLVSPTFKVVRSAKQATSTILIVMIITEDPEKTGLVDSLARPSVNCKWQSLATACDSSENKRFELLKDDSSVRPRQSGFSGKRSSRITDLAMIRQRPMCG